MDLVDPTSQETASHSWDTLLNNFAALLKVLGIRRSHEALRSISTSQDDFKKNDLAQCASNLNLEYQVLHPHKSDLRWVPTPCVIEDVENSRSIMVSHFDELTGQFVDAKGRHLTNIEQHLSDVLNVHHFRSVLETPSERPASSYAWISDVFWSYASVYRDILLASLLIQVFVIAMPLFIMNVYDRVVPNQAVETLWTLAAGMGLVIAFDLILKLLRQQLIEASALRTDQQLGDQLFAKLMHIELDELPRSSGYLSNILQQYEQAKVFFSSASFVSMIDIPFSVLFVVLIFWIGGAMAWIPLIAGGSILLLAFVVQKKLRTNMRRAQVTGAQKQNLVIETLVNIEAVHAFSMSGNRQREWERASRESNGASGVSRIIIGRMSIYAQSINQIAMLALLILGYYQVQDNQMSLGALLACVLVTSRILGPMHQAAHLLVQYFHVKMSLELLGDLLSKRSEVHEKSFADLPVTNRNLIFNQVCYAYSESANPAIRDVSLTIKQGEKVALLGRVGSGKSSLLRCAVRLSLPQLGTITWGGTDISELHPADFRRCIGFVPQNPQLFSGTLRDNILAGNAGITDADILESCKHAGLDSFIETNGLGLDYPLGDLGQGLSGGQIQCVCLARALVSDPDILVLDEFASALDNQTEQRVLSELKSATKDKTLIVSTHKSSVLSLVDRIVVLDRGRVVADGQRENVLAAIQSGNLKVPSS